MIRIIRNIRWSGKFVKYYKNTVGYGEEIHIYQVAGPNIQYKQNPILETSNSYVLFLNEMEIPEAEQETLDGATKALVFVGEGYSRYSIEGEQIKAHIPPKGNEMLSNSIRITEFEKLLQATIR